MKELLEAKNQLKNAEIQVKKFEALPDSDPSKQSKLLAAEKDFQNEKLDMLKANDDFKVEKDKEIAL